MMNSFKILPIITFLYATCVAARSAAHAANVISFFSLPGYEGERISITIGEDNTVQGRCSKPGISERFEVTTC